jgi:hypothetical protein
MTHRDLHCWVCMAPNPNLHRFYGATSGLSQATCSGRCSDGVLCEPQSTSPTGVPCPPGYVCQQGIAFPCPSGTYNPVPGGVNATTSCVPCPANTFGARNGSSSLASCQPCAPFEGSDGGASSCWPGVLGTMLVLSGRVRYVSSVVVDDVQQAYIQTVW